MQIMVKGMDKRPQRRRFSQANTQKEGHTVSPVISAGKRSERAKARRPWIHLHCVPAQVS
jgi:hypothetical protein